MKNIKKGTIDIILYVIVFAVMQIFVSLLGIFVWMQLKGMSFAGVQSLLQNGELPALLAVTTVMSNLITFLIFVRAKWVNASKDYLRSKPWASLLWVALFTLGMLIPLDFIYEHLGLEMDPRTEHIFTALLKEPWGYVAVGILAPLTEEVVFRGAILRTLLGMVSKKNHWVAILISAAIFGGLHGNEAQFVHALIMGLFLGWMYYRTNSIIPGLLLHWVNNTMAYVLTNLLPQSDGKLIDLFGGNERTVYYAVGFSLCIAVPSFIQLMGRLGKK